MVATVHDSRTGQKGRGQPRATFRLNIYKILGTGSRAGGSSSQRYGNVSGTRRREAVSQRIVQQGVPPKLPPEMTSNLKKVGVNVEAWAFPAYSSVYRDYQPVALYDDPALHTNDAMAARERGGGERGGEERSRRSRGLALCGRPTPTSKIVFMPFVVARERLPSLLSFRLTTSRRGWERFGYSHHRCPFRKRNLAA